MDGRGSEGGAAGYGGRYHRVDFREAEDSGADIDRTGYTKNLNLKSLSPGAGDGRAHTTQQTVRAWQ